jgi:two-component system response regulator HydG
LRALEQRSVRPLGSASEVPFDARVLTATHRDLEGAIEQGAFREDLYYRLNVVNISLPPLRARGGDILLLAQYFLEQLGGKQPGKPAGIARPAAEKLMGYAWPGNVRELRNCIERAVALSADDTLRVDDLPEKIRDYRKQRVAVSLDDPSELLTLEEMERRYIVQVLAACNGNRSQAAQILGLNRKTLYRKLLAYGDEP